MSKIIHLSDLHIGHKELGKRAWGIANRIILNKPNGSDYVIVLTGDLVEDGFNTNSLIEAKQLVDYLKAAKFRVLVVPGNHDVGNGGFSTKEVSRNFLKMFFDDEKKVTFPRLDVIHDTAFIGLNSMEEETGIFDGGISAEGELGQKQIDRLAKMLDRKTVQKCKYRVVYLHHHPLDYRPFLYLKDATELRNTLDKYEIDALLYGHYHDGDVWNGTWETVPRIYDGGSSTNKDDASYPHRVMDLSKHPDTDYDGKFLSDSIRNSTEG